jgi:hypothetical protein
MEIALRGETFRLKSEQWITPLALPAGNGAEPHSAEVRYGKGRIVYLGGYPGQAYAKNADPEFERLARSLADDAGAGFRSGRFLPADGKRRSSTTAAA